MASEGEKTARAVFLDRDGVLNRAEVRDGKPYAPRALQNFRLLPGAAEAVRRLKAVGFVVVVVTNQPDIGNGLVDDATVAAMHARLKARVPVDDVRICPHAQNENCACRKPAPGMLLAAADDLGLNLPASFMVGDRLGDIAAGAAAGCRTVFIDRGYAETRRARAAAPPNVRGPASPDTVVGSLPAAAAFILAQTT